MKEIVYREARLDEYQKIQKPLEDFNHLAWFPIDEAITNLKRGSHKWAIEAWKKQHQI